MTREDPGSARWLTKQPGYLHSQTTRWRLRVLGYAVFLAAFLAAFAFALPVLFGGSGQ